jgi:hypothetical protein
MNDPHDNAQTDREMLARYPGIGLTDQEAAGLRDSILTYEEYAVLGSDVEQQATIRAGGTCDVDGYTPVGDRGDESYWHCEKPAVKIIDGTKVCATHAEDLDPEEQELADAAQIQATIRAGMSDLEIVNEIIRVAGYERTEAIAAQLFDRTIAQGG